ncbi:MAG TPA: DUF2062 domain-containing protein, partial [Humisphaera sp.]|nr:DUF2062 domain-containing protein [Humisphaera sp.]
LAAVWLGHVMLHGRSLPLKELNPFQHGFLSRALPFLFDWLAGSVVLGIATGIVAFFAANLLFRLVERAEVDGDDDDSDKKESETVLSQSAP